MDGPGNVTTTGFPSSEMPVNRGHERVMMFGSGGGGTKLPSTATLENSVDGLPKVPDASYVCRMK